MLSIITPCYNSANKINKLIQSLEKQKDKNFEWVIVDDCSKMEDYNLLMGKLNNASISYNLLRNEKNIGAGLSRNRALKNSKGDYVCFVDSDDYVSDYFVGNINRQLDDKNSDIVFFNYYIEKNNHYRSCATLKDGFSSQCLTKDIILSSCSTNVCGKVYKKDLIEANNIEFPSLKRFEDWVFNIRAILKADTFEYIKKELYYYVDNNNSLTHIYTTNVCQYSLEAFKIIEQELLKYSYDLTEALFNREVIYVAALDYIHNPTFENKDTLKGLTKLYRVNLHNKYTRRFAFHQIFILSTVKFKMFLLLFLTGLGVKIIK